MANTLIFSVAGRLGSGVSTVAKSLADQLRMYDYSPTVVDVSLLLITFHYAPGEIEKSTGASVSEFKKKFDNDFSTPKLRTKKLQDLGNELRDKYGLDAIAKLCIERVINHKLEEGAGKNALIIDSLKRPEEVRLLRRVLGDAYFALGVVSSETARHERMTERKSYSAAEYRDLSKVDAKQTGVPCGQQAVQTVVESDYFFANDYSAAEALGQEVGRFLSLIFRATVVSPRVDEFGMNLAFKAAARSACLSRQVGAALLDSNRQLLSTGCNDVPKFEGGLYDAETADDKRCWTKGGKCYNDEEKRKIVNELVEAILTDPVLKAKLIPPNSDGQSQIHEISGQPQVEARLRQVIQTSRIKQLIEFTRAVHAEMDAILSAARTGKAAVAGSTLYCTTYPCHNCAKHIIDAGIIRVVYLEPYEKSLAMELHNDAMTDATAREQSKVVFENYNGVTPNRYAEFFESRGTSRKSSDGRYIDRTNSRTSLEPIGTITYEELSRRVKDYLQRTVKNSHNSKKEIADA